VDVLRLDEEMSPYGLAVVDLNDLKGINDTYGHEKGDEAIKALCVFVCKIFKYSPVYRIGGDEFVVILENTDYENRDILVETFKEEIKEISQDNSLSPWERVSTAIGCAVFDPARDKHASSVFKRADEAMYANKREMKGESHD
jgi:diguanylate cyclase (GGDEF)-like protein